MTAPTTASTPGASLLAAPAPAAAAAAPDATPATAAPADATPVPTAPGATADAATPDTPPADAAKPADAPPVELDVKLPEGFQASGEAFDSFKATAKELGLDGAKAQKLVDIYFGAQQAQAKAQEAAFAAQQEKWVAEVQADKDIGGAKLQESATHAQKALEHFAPGLAQQLDAMGLGNHPGLVRAFAKVGRAMADDSISGSSASPGKQDSEQAFLRKLYPSMFKE